MHGVREDDDYFGLKKDATATVRMLAYGVVGDLVDEYTCTCPLALSQCTRLADQWFGCLHENT
jgi:hypothetical protein